RAPGRELALADRGGAPGQPACARTSRGSRAGVVGSLSTDLGGPKMTFSASSLMQQELYADAATPGAQHPSQPSAARETRVQMIEFRLHCSHSLELDIERILDISNGHFKCNETVGFAKGRQRVRRSIA